MSRAGEPAVQASGQVTLLMSALFEPWGDGRHQSRRDSPLCLTSLGVTWRGVGDRRVKTPRGRVLEPPALPSELTFRGSQQGDARYHDISIHSQRQAPAMRDTGDANPTLRRRPS